MTFGYSYNICRNLAEIKTYGKKNEYFTDLPEFSHKVIVHPTGQGKSLKVIIQPFSPTIMAYLAKALEAEK